MYCRCGHVVGCNHSLPYRGGLGRGPPFVLHATRCTEGGGDCREDGDYYVEDLTPESVVVESSHSEIIG